MVNRIVTTVVSVTVVAVSAVAQQAVRQTERLVKRAEATVRDIGNARAQLQNTLEIYNTLMGGAGDSKKLFNDLRRAADRSEDRRDDVRKRGEDMKKEAHTFFEEWTRSLSAITNEDLTQRAQARLNATRLGFSEILGAGRRAGALFDVFMGGLGDQITYLGHDINPNGIASLKEDAERLNASAESMFARIDEVTETIGEYANSLRAQ